MRVLLPVVGVVVMLDGIVLTENCRNRMGRMFSRSCKGRGVRLNCRT